MTFRSEAMSDLISKGKLLNRIATECHYDTEHPLEAYTKLLATINDIETERVENEGALLV